MSRMRRFSARPSRIPLPLLSLGLVDLVFLLSILIAGRRGWKSNRVVTIPRSLCDCLRDYMAKCYQLRPEDRLFPYGKTYLYKEMLRGSELAGVKKIRVHDLRHSHAAALIEMNVAPKLLQDRLGHERIQTTLDTYGHLYPNAQAEVAKQLEEFMSGR